MSKWIKYRLPIIGVCLLSVLLILAGCGGGKGEDARPANASGRTVITLRWPEPTDTTRLVPAAAKSVRVTLRAGEFTVAERLLVRPTAPPWVTTVTIGNVPIMTLTSSASAYPNEDGTGAVQASVTTSVTVLPTGDTNLRLTMASTIDRIEATPNPLFVPVKSTRSLSVTAFNSAGEVVLITPSTLQCVSADIGIVTIEGNRTVRGVKQGTTTVTVTESESGKSGQVTVTAGPGMPYHLVWIGGLPGSTRSVATALNNKGEVVGYSDFPDETAPYGFRRRGWIWRPDASLEFGVFTDLGNEIRDGNDQLQQAYYMEPKAINEASQICGTAAYKSGIDSSFVAFRYRNAVLQRMWTSNSFGEDIDSAGRVLVYGPGGTYIVQEPPLSILNTWRIFPARDFTDAGVMTGSQYFPNPVQTGVVIDGENERLLPPVSGYPSSEGFAINEQGTVAGWSIIVGDGAYFGRATLWKNGVIYNIGTLTGYPHSRANDLNDKEVVVGDVADRPFPFAELFYNTLPSMRAFRWRYGKIEDLNSLILPELLAPYQDRRALITANGVNEQGMICGGGAEGAYLLLPEPGTGNVNVGVN